VTRMPDLRLYALLFHIVSLQVPLSWTQIMPLTVRYRVEEERPARTFVGDISLHPSLRLSTPPRRRYTLLRASTDLFVIDESTGVIQTSRMIDSEDINRFDSPGCRRYAPFCHVSFGVKVGHAYLNIHLFKII